MGKENKKTILLKIAVVVLLITTFLCIKTNKDYARELNDQSANYNRLLGEYEKLKHSYVEVEEQLTFLKNYINSGE